MLAADAWPGTHDVMGHVAEGHYEMVGTFNGNPMAMAATRAMLTEVATAEAYARMEPPGGTNGGGCRAVDRPTTGFAAHVVSVGAKGCIRLPGRPGPRLPGVFDSLDDRYRPRPLAHPAQGGVFLPPWERWSKWLNLDAAR